MLFIVSKKYNLSQKFITPSNRKKWGISNIKRHNCHHTMYVIKWRHFTGKMLLLKFTGICQMQLTLYMWEWKKEGEKRDNTGKCYNLLWMGICSIVECMNFKAINDFNVDNLNTKNAILNMIIICPSQKSLMWWLKKKKNHKWQWWRGPKFKFFYSKTHSIWSIPHSIKHLRKFWELNREKTLSDIIKK